MHMQIEMKRVVIRSYTMKDVKDLHAILGNAEVMRNCEPAYSFGKTSRFLSKQCYYEGWEITVYSER